MSTNKTQKTTASATAFINAIEDPDRRRECREVAKLMRASTGCPARMWGDSIVGFGDWHYESPSGRSGEWFQVGFSPRAKELTLYLISGFGGMDALRKQLGPHRTGKSCLYLKRLDDVDRDVLRRMIGQCVDRMAAGKPAVGNRKSKAGGRKVKRDGRR